MDQTQLTQWIITVLGWNWSIWQRCPAGHQGIYVMGPAWEGKLLREDYRCLRCGRFSRYVCLHCFSQQTRLEPGRLVCQNCGAVQKTS